MIMAKLAQQLDLDTIGRLEEKVKALVSVVHRLRAEQGRAAEDNQRMSRELEAARTRLAEAESRTGEVTSLIQERDEIRSRVADMLHQLEALNL